MKFRKNILYISLIAGVLISGCSPMVVDLSESAHQINSPYQQQNNRFDYKFVVLDRASEIKNRQRIFGSSLFAINTQEKPKETLEKDLNRYFEAVLVSENTNKRIVARIDRADAYWINPGVNTIPFVGLVTSFTSAYPFVFDISVTFEIEENGRVVRSYPFIQKFEIKDGNAMTPSAIQNSYKRLISEYRKMMFNSLSQEFIPRYLDKPISSSGNTKN